MTIIDEIRTECERLMSIGHRPTSVECGHKAYVAIVDSLENIILADNPPKGITLNWDGTESDEWRVR